MKISLPCVTSAGARTRIAAQLEMHGKSRTLWYEVDAELAPYLVRDRVDGFAVVGLLAAMEAGEPELVLEGPVSERLHYSLQHQLMPILRLAVPGLRDVRVRAWSLDSDGAPRGTGVVTGFSGGIDSFCTVAEHLGPSATPGYQLTHLLFCNVGSHGHGDRGRALFTERWNLIRTFGDSVGLPIVRLDSNVDELVTTSFEQSHPLRNASAVLVLQGLFAKYLYSSTYRLEDCHFGPLSDLAYADPGTLSALSTESLQCISTGCQHSRVQKTQIALRLPQIRTMLNVCTLPTNGGRNCSTCWKCLRTLATLDLLGVVDGFGEVFDLEAYRRERLTYLLLVPGRTDDPFLRELYEFAGTPAAHVPPSVARAYAFWPVIRSGFLLGKRLKRSASRLVNRG